MVEEIFKYRIVYRSYIVSDSQPFNVDMQTDSNHDTALTLAATGGHDSLVELLITRGANIEHKDKKVGQISSHYTFPRLNHILARIIN